MTPLRFVDETTPPGTRVIVVGVGWPCISTTECAHHQERMHVG